MSTVETRPITAAEFFEMPDPGPCELVRGKVVLMSPPGWRHGRIASRVFSLVDRYLEDQDLGRAVTNDSGVITEQDPDTVRGADVMYHSYQRLPRDLEPERYPDMPPEIIWEVLSPNDRRQKVLAKVAEYLEAGVLVVCVVDPERKLFTTYFPDRPEETVQMGQSWQAPEILPGFELPLEKVFRGR